MWNKHLTVFSRMVLITNENLLPYSKGSLRYNLNQKNTKFNYRKLKYGAVSIGPNLILALAVDVPKLKFTFIVTLKSETAALDKENITLLTTYHLKYFESLNKCYSFVII